MDIFNGEVYVFMSKKSGRKIVYIISSVVILLALCFVSIKFIIPKAYSGSETTFSSTKIETSTKAETITEKITEIITTTAKLTTAAPSTVLSSESGTVSSETAAQSTASAPSALVQASTASPSTIHVTDDFSSLDNSVFIGNSRVIALKNYGLAKNVYAVVGLNVDTIFTKSVSGSTVPVIDELNGKDYEKVFIMLGDNECGWPNKNIFIDKYAKVIDAVKERIPDAEIYLQSVLPVSNEASATSQFGCTNENINALNVKIEQLAADEGIHYINPASALKGPDGALPDNAASDGIHLNKSYCKIWLTYIIENINEE